LHIISINTKIHDLIKEYPEIKDIMKSLGFDNILNPIMLNTVGKVMTLKTGSEMKKIDMEVIRNKFLENNFQLEEK
jgi:Cu/Ag efflux pump CusA